MRRNLEHAPKMKSHPALQTVFSTDAVATQKHNRRTQTTSSKRNMVERARENWRMRGVTRRASAFGYRAICISWFLPAAW